MSFSARAGRLTDTPGRFTPLCSPNSPVFFIRHFISVPLIACTSRAISPSSRSIIFPGFKSLIIPAYDTANLSLFPTNE